MITSKKTGISRSFLSIRIFFFWIAICVKYRVNNDSVSIDLKNDNERKLMDNDLPNIVIHTSKSIRVSF